MPDLDDKGLEAAVAAVVDSEGWNEADMLITQRTARAAVEAYLAALPPPSGVKVRELEWVEGNAFVLQAADLYRVEDQGSNWTTDRYWLFILGLRFAKFETPEAAKAAAQADFDQRIRSALAPVDPEAFGRAAYAFDSSNPDLGTYARLQLAFAALSPSGDDRIAEPVGVAWNDEDMAMHWIDRYAGGVDAEPQMDRILDCVVVATAGVDRMAELLNAGIELANVAHNIHQRDPAAPYHQSLKTAQMRWDEAFRAARRAKGGA